MDINHAVCLYFLLGEGWYEAVFWLRIMFLIAFSSHEINKDYLDYTEDSQKTHVSALLLLLSKQ